jgi:hypothetical protein
MCADAALVSINESLVDFDENVTNATLGYEYNTAGESPDKMSSWII